MTSRSHTDSPYLPFIALAALAFLWGYNWVVMKVAVRYCDPFTFAAMRSFLSALVLFALAMARRGTLSPKPFWLTFLSGLFQTGFMGLVLWALSLGGAGRISVLVYTMPFWLLLMAGTFLDETLKGFQ